MHRYHLVLAAPLLAVALPAQIAISDGNMDVQSTAPSATSQSPRSLNLRADPLAVDHAYEHWWYYRVAGDAQEFAYRDVGGLVSGVTGGTHGDHDFADVDGRGVLKASMDFDVYSTGPISGVMISRLTVMNTSNAPIDLETFAYTDLDVANTAGNDSCTGTIDRHFVTDVTGVQVEIRAPGAIASDVGAYPGIRTNLTDSDVDDLGNTLPPLTGDYTGAFQWSSTLQPFEQRTYTVIFAVDTPATSPPVVEHYGAGNGAQFEVHANELPLQDLTQLRAFSVRMKGALPNAEYRIITGLDPWTPGPFIPGIDLWVLPVSIVGVYGGFTDANGEAAETFFVPPSLYLTGTSVYHQCFYVDAAAPNGFAYWTPGLRTTIGKF